MQQQTCANFINILCTIFLYEHCFRSLFYVHVLEKSCGNNVRTKKIVRKNLQHEVKTNWNEESFLMFFSENTLILAISTATDDIANSVAIKNAKKVDRDGSRTIGKLAFSPKLI